MGLGGLFTDHDIFNFHKILGFGCLANYGYRIGCKFIYGSMCFTNNSMIHYLTPMVHLSLSLSSFIFQVPKYRINSKVIIWKELQLHNIIFTSRSVFMMYHTLLMNANNPYYHYTRLGIVLGHHILADVVSYKYKIQEKTTTRDIPYMHNKLASYVTKKFYGISQLYATYTIMTTLNYENGLLIMFPIQLSTFLMTLVRKQVISNNVWHVLYSISLAIPFLINTNMIHPNNYKVYVASMFVISRLVFGVDKYANIIAYTLLTKSV